MTSLGAVTHFTQVGYEVKSASAKASPLSTSCFGEKCTFWMAIHSPKLSSSASTVIARVLPLSWRTARVKPAMQQSFQRLCFTPSHRHL